MSEKNNDKISELEKKLKGLHEDIKLLRDDSESDNSNIEERIEKLGKNYVITWSLHGLRHKYAMRREKKLERQITELKEVLRDVNNSLLALYIILNMEGMEFEYKCLQENTKKLSGGDSK